MEAIATIGRVTNSTGDVDREGEIVNADRQARLRGAIGNDLAFGIDADEQVGLVTWLLDRARVAS